MNIDFSVDLPTIVVMVGLAIWLWKMQGRAEDRLKADIAELKKDLKTDIGGLRSELKDVEAVARQTDRDIAHLTGRLEPYDPQPTSPKPKLVKRIKGDGT